MLRRKGNPSPRFRVGKVTLDEHHGTWWVDYRDAGQSHRAHDTKPTDPGTLPELVASSGPLPEEESNEFCASV